MDPPIEVGGSFRVDPSIGVETFTFESNGKKYAGFNLLGGTGVAYGGAEVHSGAMNTTVVDLFNLYDEWSQFLEEYKAW